MITKSIVIENSSVVCLARVRKSDGTYLTQADTSALTVNVFSLNDHSQISSATPVITDCVFDDLQTDARWDVDTTGYNLALPIDADSLPDGNITYQVECNVTTNDGLPFYVVWQLQTKDILSE